MENRTLSQRKLYAMMRMGKALDRAVGEQSTPAKERAAKWAAAWGLLVGIQTREVQLKPARDVIDQRRSANPSSFVGCRRATPREPDREQA